MRWCVVREGGRETGEYSDTTLALIIPTLPTDSTPPDLSTAVPGPGSNTGLHHQMT